MKLNTITSICLALFLLAGCQENEQESSDNYAMNSGLIASYYDIAVNNAIVSQHTLYPYHFITNGKELNELGNNDLMVLIKHFMENPGKLNIRQGNVSTEIYKARINFVFTKMIDAGIGKDKVSVSDDMPGGSGMSSEKVLTILKNES